MSFMIASNHLAATIKEFYSEFTVELHSTRFVLHWYEEMINSFFNNTSMFVIFSFFSILNIQTVKLFYSRGISFWGFRGYYLHFNWYPPRTIKLCVWSLYIEKFQRNYILTKFYEIDYPLKLASTNLNDFTEIHLYKVYCII